MNSPLKSMMYLLQQKFPPLFCVMACGWYIPDMDFTREKSCLHDFQLIYVRSGQIVIEAFGKKHIISAKQAIVWDISKEFSQMPVKETDWEIMWCHFGGNASEQLVSIINEMGMVVSIPENSQFEDFFYKIITLAQTKPLGLEFGMSVYLHGLLSEMLISALQETKREIIPTKNSIIINKVNNYIEDHYKEKVTIKSLANYVHLSPFHFSRVFKQINGKSVAQYIIHYKIEKCKLLLKYTQKPVREITEEFGFTDISHFWKNFKKIVGVTPAAYRLSKDSIDLDSSP